MATRRKQHRLKVPKFRVVVQTPYSKGSVGVFYTKAGEAYAWSATAKFSGRDRGISDSIERAKNCILKDAGISERQYEVKIEE